MLVDWIMILMAGMAFVLAGMNVAYGLLSYDGPHRFTVLVRGLICGYIGLIYTAYLSGMLPEPMWMRYLMRGAIFTILLLFMFDTLTMWREREE